MSTSEAQHPETHPGKVGRVTPHRSKLSAKHPVEPRPRVGVGQAVAEEPLGLGKEPLGQVVHSFNRGKTRYRAGGGGRQMRAAEPHDKMQIITWWIVEETKGSYISAAVPPGGKRNSQPIFSSMERGCYCQGMRGWKDLVDIFPNFMFSFRVENIVDEVRWPPQGELKAVVYYLPIKRKLWSCVHHDASACGSRGTLACYNSTSSVQDTINS